MLGRIKSLFGRGTKHQPKAGVQLAMPLFEDNEPISAQAILEEWTHIAGDLKLEIEDEGKGVIIFRLGDARIMCMHVPMPIATGEVAATLETSWMWQQGSEIIDQHRAHAIVTANNAKPVADAWNVARLSAAMLKAGKGAGLYWGNSRQVHAPELVASFVQGETPPVPLWVGITVSGESEQGPFSAATHGLEVFGHKEFEVRDTHMPVGDLRTTLLDLCLYVLERGPILLDGETFGPNPSERWSVKHESSQLVPEREAIVLGIP